MKTGLNKKITTAALAALLTVSLLPITSYACRNGGQKWKHDGMLGIWRNAQIIQDAGLNDEQVHNLKEADFTAREKQQALQAELDNLHLKMDQAFSADTIDEEAIRNLSKKIAATKGQMIEQRTENSLILRKLLTPEQLDKLNGQGGGGRGFGMGKGNDGSPPCRMNGQGGGGNGMRKGQGKM